MFTFLIVVIAIIGLIMALVILVQSGKGGGLAGIAAGGATTQILGARQAPDVLEKATWTLAALFIVLCILTNFAIDTGDRQQSIIQQQAQQGQPVAPAPVAPAPATETPAPSGDTPASQEGQPQDQ